jgi:hypothetical protein
MIGEIELIEHLAENQPIASVFVIVGKHNNFDPKEQGFIKIKENLLPKEFYNKNYIHSATIVTGNRRPKVDTLPYLKGQLVHLIHSSGSDSLFASWVAVVSDSKPKCLVCLDSENEMYVS